MPAPRLVVRPVPIVQDGYHPDPPHPALPKHEFTMGFIAPKGSGKTTCLMNILSFYAEYFHTILIFSPTLHNDEKWATVKTWKLLARNRELETFLRTLASDGDHRLEQPYTKIVVGPPPLELDRERRREDDETDPHRWNGRIPEKCFVTEYDETLLRTILDDQQQMIDFLAAHGKTKHLANRLLLVFDDMVGSSLFGMRRNNVFRRLNTNHRHYSASLLMVSQAYHEIPKTVRINWSCLILFEIPNEREVETSYEENPMGLKKAQWMEMYAYAVAQPYSFLYIK